MAVAQVRATHCFHETAALIETRGAASLESPKEIPEAAEVDGAGFWRKLFQIDLPMMLPIINVAVLFGIIFTFTDMTVVF